MARKSRKGSVETPAVQEQDVVYNAAAYIRLSSDAKRKPGDSLYNQQDIIENFIAASPDIRLADIYIDNQATGTNFERPAFVRMLEDVESGRINCIIVKDLSRFGRNAIDCGYYIEKHLPALGVRFIAVTDSFDSLEGDGGVMLPLKNVIAESYALDISRKCRSVQRQNIQDGRFVGRMAPYGFSKAPEDCHRLIIDEEAAPIVRQIFDWAASGMGVGEIIRMLNEKGVLPPSHYKWEKGQILVDRWVLFLPVFGPLLRKAAVAKFSRTLATMVSSGVPILNALDIVSRTSGNKTVEKGVLEAKKSIAEGQSLAEPLDDTGVFPPMVIHMISIGETTGALDSMLTKIADFYDDEVDVAVDALTSLIEPIMIVFLGVVVGGLVISMYLPIFSIADTVA